MSPQEAANSEILRDLAAIGFSESESRLYLALITTEGAATAYELAKAAQIPVANTYNVMRSLEKKGASRQVSGKPARYVATPPSELLQVIAEETARRTSSLIERFEQLRPPQSKQYVEVLSGRNLIERRIARMITDAQKQVVLKGRSHLPADVQDALERAIERGVQCLFVYYGDEPKLPKGDVHLWPHEGNGRDIGRDYLTVTADAKAALASDRETFNATFSENDTFVYLAEVLLRHEIYLAEIMTAVGASIEQKFGPALYRLREKFATMPVSPDAWVYIQEKLGPSAARQPRRGPNVDTGVAPQDAPAPNT